MTFKEARQREKAEMTPLRYKFNYRVLPTYMAVFACLIAASIAVGETVTPDLWVLLPLGAAVALIAVMAALICVAGPLSISIGPIPLTLSNFAVYLAAAVLGGLVLLVLRRR